MIKFRTVRSLRSLRSLLRAGVIGLVVVAVWASGLARVPASARAQDERLHIVANFTILADVAQVVAGDAADVESLIPVGVDPHSYEAGAQDVVRLSEADAVLIVGMSFEASLASVINEAAGDRVLVVSECVPVRVVPEGVVMDHEHEGEEHEGEHTAVNSSSAVPDCAAAAPTIAASFGFGEDAGTLPDTQSVLAQVDCGDIRCDPHVWTDPVSVAWWVVTIRDHLAALDPAHADVYEANASAYLEELGALHGEIAAQMSAIPEENRLLVTNHMAFNYLAARYDLTTVGVVLPGGSTTAEPSVQDVMTLIETIQDLGVSVVFTETAVSDDLAQQIADEAGITTVQLLTGSLDAPGSGADTYLGYMRTNAARITEALSGE